MAGTRAPYFNRTWAHFCSHQHTPYRLERNPSYDAVVQSGNVIYFSHRVFAAYAKSGQPLLKYLVRGAITRLLPEPSLQVSMPSSGRVSLMEQQKENRLLLHLLFAQTQRRGENMEIIEDVVPIHDVACDLALPRAPARVYSAYGGTDIEHTYNEGRLTLTVPAVEVHELVVVER